jgi:flotillin
MPNSVVVIVGLAVAATLILITLMARLFRKAGPNEALIVYGFRGPRIIRGHGAVIFPVVENCRLLSLELMSFDVAPKQDLYTRQGVAVTVEAVAQIKVRSDNESILTAAEQFLSLYASSWKVTCAASLASSPSSRSSRSRRWWPTACAPPVPPT